MYLAVPFLFRLKEGTKRRQGGFFVCFCFFPPPESLFIPILHSPGIGATGNRLVNRKMAIIIFTITSLSFSESENNYSKCCVIHTFNHHLF